MSDADRLARLTERERVYLRLVYNAMSSKEIAYKFGVEPGTVDKALKSAMAKLGTSSRRVAARMLAEAHTQKLAPQPQSLEPSPNLAMMEEVDNKGIWQPTSYERVTVQEEQAAYLVGDLLGAGIKLPVPRKVGERNDLSLQERLIWIGALTFGIVVVTSALIAISGGAVRLASQLFRTLT